MGAVRPSPPYGRDDPMGEPKPKERSQRSVLANPQVHRSKTRQGRSFPSVDVPDGRTHHRERLQDGAKGSTEDPATTTDHSSSGACRR
eukprot:scaffold1771_cov343-Pavlova_lutheri.AAC.11